MGVARPLTSVDDDESVVVEECPMERRMTVEEYLTGEETNRPQELAYGVLREPPAPGYNHQRIVGRLYSRLDVYVRAQRLGQVVLSPVDVVLDPVRALVVQPDVVFVASTRLDICTHHIAGAPDLVVEVLSTSNRRHDRSVKVGWYRAYGVRECWVVDPIAQTVEVFDFLASDSEPRLFHGDERIASALFPDLQLSARQAFFD
jgi:Uma2 family endonuclease